jgi:hypothetical protein
MDVCRVHHDGDMGLHQHRQAAPAPFLQAIAPSRARLAVAVEGLFPWSWLAALWAHAGMACGLGPALSMQARHGGKANNDQSAAHKMAVWLRGGLLPHASVSPAARRAPRA